MTAERSCERQKARPEQGRLLRCAPAREPSVLGGIGLRRVTAHVSRLGLKPTTGAFGVTRWAAGRAVLLRRSHAENGNRRRTYKPAFYSGLRAVRWPPASFVRRGPFSEGRNRPPGLRTVTWTKATFRSRRLGRSTILCPGGQFSPSASDDITNESAHKLIDSPAQPARMVRAEADAGFLSSLRHPPANRLVVVAPGAKS
jgi:hypothetical protein